MLIHFEMKIEGGGAGGRETSEVVMSDKERGPDQSPAAIDRIVERLKIYQKESVRHKIKVRFEQFPYISTLFMGCL